MPEAWLAVSLRFRPHRRYLGCLTILVVGGPLADLFAVFELTGAHFCSVLPEPFPVAGRHAIDGLTFCPDAAVTMILDVFLCSRSLRRQCVTGPPTPSGRSWAIFRSEKPNGNSRRQVSTKRLSRGKLQIDPADALEFMPIAEHPSCSAPSHEG